LDFGGFPKCKTIGSQIKIQQKITHVNQTKARSVAGPDFQIFDWFLAEVHAK